jgi:hypothetical protein
LADACADYLDFFVEEFNNPKSWWYGVHNYNGVNGGSAGCLALALGDAFPDRAEGWIAECEKIISRWLSTGFDEEGACLEGVSYSGYGLSNTVLFGHALARSGKGDLFSHPIFDRLPEYYALSLLPGERVFDARNDSSYTGMNVSALGLAAARKSGLYQWLWETTGTDKTFLRVVWDNDVAPVDPASAGVPPAQHFRGRGLCIWRTGWTERDVMFSIEAGPYYPVTHNQADKGHFTLYGPGRRWAVDTGYANEHEPKGRGQTVGHSCVLIDGKGQALSGAGLGTNGTIAQYENNDRYGYALADCTEAYNRNNKGTPGAVVEHAKRHVFFVYPRNDAPAYAVVMDDIRKDDQPHEFTWQMIYPDQTEVTIQDGHATLRPVDRSEPRLRVHFDASSEAAISTDVFEPEDYHGPAAFPRLRAAVHGVEPRFLAVLLPLPGEVKEPAVDFESIGEKRLVRITWPGHTDVLEWPAGDGTPRLLESP